MDKYEVIKLDNQLCFSFYAISREVIKLYKPILDKFNLTYTQYITMLVLWEEEEINFKRLGERLRLDSGTLTPVVKKLEAMDLLTKYRTKEDDRVVVVKLTAKGKDLKDDIIEVPKELACKVAIEEDKYLELKKSLKDFLEKLN
jgi:MarR family transcriptional regulator, organic hydroperoxide resistance regulator